MRVASAPDRAENSSIISVTGSSAVPATTGENPLTTCSWSASRNSTPPKAP